MVLLVLGGGPTIQNPESDTLLGGSWVVISGAIGPL